MVSHRLPAVIPWNVKANDGSAPALQGMGQIRLDDAPGQLFISIFLDVGGKLILEDIGQPLEENQRQNEILELGSIRRPPNGAGCIPQPGLQSGYVQVLVSPHRQP